MMRHILTPGIENHETFMARVAATMFGTLDPKYIRIEKAYNLAKDAFRGMYREDNETRYFEHLRAVALILIVHLRVRDPNVIVAAILHDILENCPGWTPTRLVNEVGYESAFLVESASKAPKREGVSKQQRDHEYDMRLQLADRRVILIKLADRWHNMLTLWVCGKEKILFKIEETRRVYLPLAEKEILLIHELEAAVSDAQVHYNRLVA